MNCSDYLVIGHITKDLLVCGPLSSIEKLGVTGIPSRQQVEACLLTSSRMDV
jgi:hypothetical protein